MEFSHACYKHKANIFIAAFQVAEKALEYCLVMLLHLRLVNKVEQRLVILIYKYDALQPSLLIDFYKEILKTSSESFTVIGDIVKLLPLF